MDNQPNVFESLIGNTQDYVETRLNLFKLKAIDKASDAISSAVVFVPLMIIFTLVFFFLNIGLALLIGDLLGKAWLGFMILTGFYLIVGFIIYALRNKLVKVPVANMLIRKILNNSKV